jgi:hypothetical protein
MSYNVAFVSTSLLNPLTLSFCLGALARFARSELTVPKDVYAGISLFLLFAIGLKVSRRSSARRQPRCY